MDYAKLLCGVVLVTAVLASPAAAPAMDLPHYDLDSLVYTSTDIVTATLSVQSERQISATVGEALYGGLKAGDRIETLAPFLSFFYPIENGQRVILFLDSHPRKPDFFNPEASKAPFAVLPSGVYLIDAWEHVHQYSQMMNPGPYFAEGYYGGVPTKERDLALPALTEVILRISASLKSVEALRPLLDKVATSDDATPLMDLLETRTRGRKYCGSNLILDRLGNQLRSLDDPEISLKAFSLSPDLSYPTVLLNNRGIRDTEYTAARVKYLIQAVSDAKKIIALRIAAMETLLQESSFHSGPPVGPGRSLPIDNVLLAPFATEIQSLAKSIFDDEKQDDRLRSLSLQFIAIDQPGLAADVKQVYSRTKSEQLRFAVEDAFLELGDAFYEALSPNGGPITSGILAAPEHGCAQPNGDNIAFVEKHHLRKDFLERAGEAGNKLFVLTNLRTNQRFIPGFSLLSYVDSGLDGEMTFELASPLEVPVGDYSFAPEFVRNGQVISTGHKLIVEVSDTATGRKLSLK